MTRLRKLKSKLQFQLHVQEFVELIRQDNIMQALAYARKSLAPCAATAMAEVQHAVALLVFRSTTSNDRYKPLLAGEQWEVLVQLFMQDLFRLHTMPRLSALDVHLQAGLTALKSPLSYEEGCTREDPIPHMRGLAEPLPWAKHVTSKLICAITKKTIDDSNPPIVLPNGYVYGQDGIDDLAAKNDGRVLCPVTGCEYLRSDCVQAFIL